MQHSTADFAKRLLRWYDQNRRDLPWRMDREAGAEKKLDPYHVMVSEAMLQQTQVATVIPYYKRFIETFPTLESLAKAPMQDVLRLWQGLGYYSRARNLQAAAKKILAEFGGKVPSEVPALLKLPGVGRYTAGAIASIAFNTRAPIVDGNVLRVLCRLDRIETDPREKTVWEILWARAEELLPSKRAGDFNSALMELGGRICTPRSPQCRICPVNKFCKAFEAGVQEQIPIPKKTKAIPLVRRWTVCIRRGNQWLIEQRPEKGRWAGMWQFVTIPPDEGEPSSQIIKETTGLNVTHPKKIGTTSCALSHRRYEFEVYECEAKGKKKVKMDRPRIWATSAELKKYPLSRPQVEIEKLATGHYK